MPPPIPLTVPEQGGRYCVRITLRGKPGEVQIQTAEGNRVDMRWIGILEYLPRIPCIGICDIDSVVSLQAVEELGRYLSAVRHPIHVRDVMLTWIPRKLEPADSGRLSDVDNADPAVTVCGAGLRIVIAPCDRNRPRRVIEKRPLLNPRLIELPEGNRTGVGTPTKTVPYVQFLFVHPVRGPVDDICGAIFCKLVNCVRTQVFDIEVVLSHVGDFAAVR